MIPEDQELVDYYDEAGNVIGTCSRLEAEEKNYTYPSVIVFVFTPDGRVWAQQRSQQKVRYPGMWDTTAAGALGHDEDPKVAAERELQEEMNISCDLVFVEKFLSVFPSEDKTFNRSRMSFIFMGESDQTPVGNEEVAAIEAWDAKELQEEIKRNPDNFVPSFDIEIEKVVAARQKL